MYNLKKLKTQQIITTGDNALSFCIWNVPYWTNQWKNSSLLWSQAVFIIRFPVRPELCCSIVTSRCSRAAHKYLSLTSFNFNRGRKTNIFELNKSLFTDLRLLSPCGPVILDMRAVGTWERQEDCMWNKDVTIVGFYTSAETTHQNLLRSAVWGE